MYSPEYRHYVATQGSCLVRDRHGPRLPEGMTPCSGPIDPHHIRKGSGAGGGQKPGDEYVNGFCHAHHAEYHQIGHDSFNDRYRLDDLDYLHQQRRLLAAFTELVLTRLAKYVRRNPR